MAENGSPGKRVESHPPHPHRVDKRSERPGFGSGPQRVVDPIEMAGLGKGGQEPDRVVGQERLGKGGQRFSAGPGAYFGKGGDVAQGLRGGGPKLSAKLALLTRRRAARIFNSHKGATGPPPPTT
jgi:hypothetical protein